MSQDFLSPDEVVALLPGLKKKTLAQWRYEKKGPPYYKLGRVILYAIDELEEWIRHSSGEGDLR
ncbi:helix-turn-helix domain-containing protein [Microbacter sp. GSS18]|nr:helix-turn-helix domain-containing protein [Microbacter sp. GSS18]